MRFRFALMCALACFGTSAARAQRAGEDALKAADDAFGTSVGNETIGLYSPSSARGFSPSDAGNVRIEGLYFDQQASLNNRLISGSTVHVGISAQAYTFPAPTGIADFHLRIPGDKPLVSGVVRGGPYNTIGLEVDAQYPVISDRLSIGVGGSAYEFDNDPKAPNFDYAFAAIARFTPSDNAELVGFWGRHQDCHYGFQPNLFTAGPYLPPRFPFRQYFGQAWGIGLCTETNVGALGRFTFGNDWTLRSGVFRSYKNFTRTFFEFLNNIQPSGLGQYSMVVQPPQLNGSWSGETRLTKVITDGPFRHKFDAALRGRSVDRDFGGAQVLDFGTKYVTESKPFQEPVFNFGQTTHDHTRQGTTGVSYDGMWLGVGELGLGVQKTFYHRDIDQPGFARKTASASPMLYNAALNVFVTKALALYGSYTRGLEEAGIAPNNAANRGEAMPASITKQVDAGLRYSITPKLTAVAGVFQVEKPYFNLDRSNVFGPLGTVRHRGVELSIAGSLIDGMTVVGGAVLLQPRLSGDPINRGVVGRIPVGPPPRSVQLTLQYGPQSWNGFSIDGQVQNGSAQVARFDNTFYVDAWTQFNLGARYVFKVWDAPASLRAQAFNITNAYSWGVNLNGSYFVRSPRRAQLTFAVDFR